MKFKILIFFKIFVKISNKHTFIYYLNIIFN